MAWVRTALSMIGFGLERYPSLTDPGRVRFGMNTSLKFRVTKDLYWRFGYYLDADSRPPQNVPKTDYGSTSSQGWTF
jgi:hypothetical protein